jgi:hypothetical protein
MHLSVGITDYNYIILGHAIARSYSGCAESPCTPMREGCCTVLELGKFLPYIKRLLSGLRDLFVMPVKVTSSTYCKPSRPTAISNHTHILLLIGGSSLTLYTPGLVRH